MRERTRGILMDMVIGLLVIVFVLLSVHTCRSQEPLPDTIYQGVVQIDGAPPDSMRVVVVIAPTLDSLMASFEYIQAGHSRWFTFIRMQDVYSYPGGLIVNVVEQPETLIEHAQRTGVTWRELMRLVAVFFHR